MLVLIALSIFTVILTHRRWRTLLFRNLSLPPGPPTLPFVGAILSKPVHSDWLTYTRWAKEYGDVVFFDVLGTPTVVLNTYESAIALLEKRSANYASRPRMVHFVGCTSLAI